MTRYGPWLGPNWEIRYGQEGNPGAGTGAINPRPRVTVTSDAPTARVYDGDGGLSHGP